MDNQLSSALIGIKNSHAIRILLSCIFLAGFILIVGYGSGVFVGDPKGYDAFNHLAVAKIIKENFPHIFWNAYWDKGEIIYPRGYPPLYHFSLGIFAHFVPIDLLFLYKWTSIGSMILTAIFLFGIVWRLTKNLSASLVAGLFYPASSATWFYFVTTGLYSRIFAMMILAFGIFVWLDYFLNANKNANEKARMDANGDISINSQNYNSPTNSHSNLLYLLAILGATFVLLSHFLVVIMFGVFVFLFFLLGMEDGLQERIVKIAKVLVPASLLSAFFYVPFYFMTSENTFREFGKEIYKTISFWSFFRSGTYPGLPLFSIPFAFLVSIITFLARGKVKDICEYRFFWLFGLLFLACLFYSLGIYHHYFSGTSPDHFLAPTAFFLALFLGLGVAILAKSKILSSSVAALVILVLVTLGFAQMPTLRRNTYDMFAKWSELPFTSLDQSRLYRFGHRDEVLGAAFNYYSMTLQTRGYFVPSLLYPEFHNWYEKAVFLESNNLPETKFLLDWFGVRGLYVFKQPGAMAKFGGQASDEGEYVWKEARPILQATNKPVLLFKEDWDAYQTFLRELASKDLDSRYLIPIMDQKAHRKNFSARVITSAEEVVDTETEELAKQEPKFVYSGKSEILLKDRFKGVLFKESYYPRWKAYLETQINTDKSQIDTDNTDLKIYLAGTGMMYVALPEDYPMPAKVVFEYQVGWEEKTGAGITLGMLVFGIGWMVRKKRKLT